MSAGDLWIFGYGSLVWRPAFEHVERAPASVRGWARRFWQGSIDHRGVPEAPGRVVTLIRDAQSVCHGMAYRVAPEHAGAVLAGLDHREQGGYAREIVEIELLTEPKVGLSGRRTPTRRALMYLATESNPNYLGPASEVEIARQVAGAAGPSGPNPEYVVRLAEALRALDASDPHVFAIDRHLRRILQGVAPRD